MITADELAKELNDGGIIPLDRLHLWMWNDDIEILGVIYNFISNKKNVKSIVPRLSRDSAREFLSRYFKRCLLEDPKGDWSDSRYSAGWDFSNWLKASWVILSDAERFFWRDWLGNIYIAGDDSLRLAIETAILEHLLSNKDIAKFFVAWSSHAVLGVAYKMALKF